ncbi:MAG: glycosyltransferase family 2 protein [Phycisphaerales bacterium]
MTMLAWVLWCASVPIAALALVMTVANLRRYLPLAHTAWPGRAGGGPAAAPQAVGPLISVCIPARNEEANLAPCVESLLAAASGSGTATASVEIMVYDDQSTDRTAEIVADLCARDARIRRVPTRTLPPGWNGKQHACDRMGRAARGAWLLFTDADVRFAPGTLARDVVPALAAADHACIALLSTFPRQITGTLAERLIVPMIHFILFAYLPMGRMRGTLDPAASAGCGQFLLVRREAYLAAGGHASFKHSMHDGIMLPRALRRAGFKTDLFDGTGLCSVRMYTGLTATWRGFTKNAYEGLGNLFLLVLLTLLHLVGHVLPWGVVAWSLLGWPWPERWPGPGAWGPAALAVALNLVQRTLLALRFRQPPLGIVLHPVGVLLMTAIQWHSFLLHITGRRAWRGRIAP